jgi:kinesin family protein 2/24
MAVAALDRDFTVIFRVRPLPCSNDRTTISVEDATINKGQRPILTIAEPKKSRLLDSMAFETRSFAADFAYGPDAPTDSLFKDVIKSLVSFAMNGGFANVLAYGQTGSGKTFTMSGCSHLVAQSIFSIPYHVNLYITVLAIEIYGKSVFDLATLSKENVSVIEDVQGHVQIKCQQTTIQTSTELEKFLQTVWSSRQTHATMKNDTSSRSHVIIRLEFKSKSDGNAMTGTLQLVDLAGSERASSDSINHSKERFKESVEINKSLMTMKECIRQRTIAGSGSSEALSAHIPYRASKLTLLLKEAFELSSPQPAHTVFIATVSAHPDDVSASINTLRYASSLLAVVPRSTVLIDSDPTNVFQWSHEDTLVWLQQAVGRTISDPRLVLPFENGWTLSKIPEQEFIRRLMISSDGRIGEKRARSVYLDFWQKVVSSRTKKRSMTRKAWTKKFNEERKKQDLEYVRIYTKQQS